MAKQKAPARRKKDAADATTSYAKDVAAGRVVAGRPVRLAAERHLRDLKEGKRRGLRFDAEAAARFLKFCRTVLRLAGGRHEGRPFEPLPWQQFVFGCLFGWKRADGKRRFRTAYIEAGKGSGKSPMLAAIGLYMLVADGEARAEVYSAAAKKEQASILFRDAAAMVDQSPALKRRIAPTGPKGREWNLAYTKTMSFFRPIASDEAQSGPRPHCGLIDEVHEHKNALVIDMMSAGTKFREQSLVAEITNSGWDRSSVCWHHHEYSLKVLEGSLGNDEWFAYVCSLDPCAAHRAEGRWQPEDGCPDCDDWRDEGAWPKSNPSLGVTIDREYLRRQVREAEGIPTRESTVKRLNFCLWVVGVSSWLPAELWARGGGAIDTAALKGRPCYGGLDLSSRIDLTAWVLAFPDFPSPGQVTLLPRFWLPKATAVARQKDDGVPYLVWHRQGHIALIDGEVIDQGVIEAQIEADSQEYDLRMVKFDPWNASQLVIQLMAKGVACEEFKQSLANFNEPSKQFEAILKDGRLRHGEHPCLSWCASNVTVYTDASGNIRPLKPAHGEAKRVDGVVAAVMALSGCIFAQEAGPSVYESRGIASVGGEGTSAPDAERWEWEDEEDDW